MKLIRCWLADGARKLETVSSQPVQEIIWIAQHLFPTKNISLISDENMTEIEEEELNQLLLRRQSKEPLGYLLGSVPFLQATIETAPPILIPRPETEEMTAWLVEQIKNSNKNRLAIADICTGSGCIAVALGLERPQADIIAIDISPEAIKLAQSNVTKHGLRNITITLGNFLDPLEKKSIDIIICNPPYLSKKEWRNLDYDVKNWESDLALTDQDDGLTWYRLLAKKGKEYLRSIDDNLPRIICEIGHTQGEAVQSIFVNARWQNVQIHKDLSQKDRWVTAC